MRKQRHKTSKKAEMLFWNKGNIWQEKLKHKKCASMRKKARSNKKTTNPHKITQECKGMRKNSQGQKCTRASNDCNHPNVQNGERSHAPNCQIEAREGTRTDKKANNLCKNGQEHKKFLGP
jgi:hypothetical protein